MKTFEEMKKNRLSSFEKLNSEVEKLKSSFNKEEDNRFWKLTRDESGNGAAVIRFLPAPKGEDLPWVRFWTHAFQGPGGNWYIEKSLTTLGLKDPVSEYNSELWATGDEAKKDIARKQKRRLRYVTNILVIKDPANPENEGKVFLFEFGKKIFDKINDLMHPVEDALEERKPINPFDFWEGADFKLRCRMYERFPNYDKSEFCEPSPLFGGDDEKLKELWEKEYSLQELISPDKFKSYDELKKRLDYVLGIKRETTNEKSISLENEVVKDNDVLNIDPTVSDVDDDELEDLIRLAEEE